MTVGRRPAVIAILVILSARVSFCRNPISRFSMETVCSRADISRPTLYKVENGDPSVAIGIYVQVLRVLGLVEDLSSIAKEDVLRRRLQDESLPQRKRAPRKKPPTGDSDG
ncbi:helix-turn-helix domain-containing protein [Geotalea uraniireducens]|nr:XRE family transcriptional regulator [Geotalea uraniireducens]